MSMGTAQYGQEHLLIVTMGQDTHDEHHYDDRIALVGGYAIAAQVVTIAEQVNHFCCCPLRKAMLTMLLVGQDKGGPRRAFQATDNGDVPTIA